MINYTGPSADAFETVGYLFFDQSQSVPEHHAEYDVGPETEVTRDDALVESAHSFLPERLGQALRVRRVQKAAAFGVHTC